MTAIINEYILFYWYSLLFTYLLIILWNKRPTPVSIPQHTVDALRNHSEPLPDTTGVHCDWHDLHAMCLDNCQHRYMLNQLFDHGNQPQGNHYIPMAILSDIFFLLQMLIKHWLLKNYKTFFLCQINYYFFLNLSAESSTGCFVS